MSRGSSAAPLIVGGLGIGLLLLVVAGGGSATAGAARVVKGVGETMQGMIGRFFSWVELTDSGTARRLGLDNTPPPEVQAALKLLVEVVLDPLREGLGRPVGVIVAYRSPAVNAVLKGASSTSQHMAGEAADIKVAGLDATQLARAILALGLPFDQLIGYAPERGGHVHVSYTARRRNRGEVLWAPGSGGYVGWKPGIA